MFNQFNMYINTFRILKKKKKSYIYDRFFLKNRSLFIN
jgi:hypothetical protein